MRRGAASYLTLALVGALLGAPSFALPAHGQAQSPDQLKAVEEDLRNAQTQREQLQKENDTLSRDIGHAQQARVALAKDIQDQEYSILLLENRITALEADADRRSTALVRRDAQMKQALLALERLALHPGDALSLTPLAPDDAVRAAILLRAAVPQIAASTTTLQKELADIYHRRSEIVAQREQMAAAAAVLADQRMKLDAMIEAKTTRQAAVTVQNASAEARMSALSRQAEDLRALFAKLAVEKARKQGEEREARRIAAAAAKKQERIVLKPPPGVAPSDQAASAPDDTDIAAHAPRQQQTASLEADTADDVSSSRPFSKAKGTLPFPAVGKLVTRYGEAAGNGPATKGITIATRAGATVVTPYDGVIAFAGPFRGYGELLIIEHSEGYHTLMAGMARIDSAVGQHVLAGEPVAVMAGDGEPTLYVELRRDGQPINPLPWLADRGGSAKTR